MTQDEKKGEEQKRDRCWDPAAQLRVLQATIDWVDFQQPVPRNSRMGCRIAERIQLERLEAAKQASLESEASGLAE
jgi:hypothetical protein